MFNGNDKQQAWRTFNKKQSGCDSISDGIAGDALVAASIALGQMQYRQVSAVVVHRATRRKGAVALKQSIYMHFLLPLLCQTAVFAVLASRGELATGFINFKSATKPKKTAHIGCELLNQFY